jgi:hypothetical protein
MFPPNQGPDQHAVLLQMLKTERIALEDAEELFRLWESEQGDQPEEREEPAGASDGVTDSTPETAAVQMERRSLSPSWSAGLVAFAARLRHSLSGIEHAVRQTLQAMDLQSALDRCIAGAHTASEGRLSEGVRSTDTLLVIDNPWGDVVLRGAPESTGLEIAYRVAALSDTQRAANYNATYTRISVERRGDELHLEVTPPSGVSKRRVKIDVAVNLPPALPVRVRNECGDFTAAQLDARVEYSGGIGEIVLKRLRGTVTAQTDLGNITAELVPDEQVALDAQTAVGSIDIQAPISPHLQSDGQLLGNGFATGTLSGASLHMRTSSGTVTITAP